MRILCLNLRMFALFVTDIEYFIISIFLELSPSLDVYKLKANTFSQMFGWLHGIFFVFE